MNVGMHGGISPELIVTEDTRVDVTLNETDQITDVWCKSFSYKVKSTTTTITEGNITNETSGHFSWRD